MSTHETAPPPGQEHTASVAGPREIPLLAGLSSEDLSALIDRARQLTLGPDEVVIREGMTGNGLYILLEGELVVSRCTSSGEVVLAVCPPGSFLGEMSLVERRPHSATVRTVKPSRLLLIDPADFQRLLRSSSSAAATVLHTIIQRLRSTEASLVQSANLASLGTLAAGLAHELNNPAAALRSGIGQLAELLVDLQRTTHRTSALGLGETALHLRPEQGLSPGANSSLYRGGGATMQAIQGMAAEWPRRGAPAGSGYLQEDDLIRWLQHRCVPRAAALGPDLLAGGWDRESLERAITGIPDEAATVLLEALAVQSAISALVAGLKESATSISEIVSAVRAHSALGGTMVATYDVATGLNAALTLLRSRFGQGIRVSLRLAADLPMIEAYGGEPNHIWSNLIENAVEAVAERGEILVAAEPRDGGVRVTVEDDGPGIPQEVRQRIFEPFFTTRPVGSGTGLGLHVALGIVQRHGGSISFESRPGRTEFAVWLPLELPFRASSTTS